MALFREVYQYLEDYFPKSDSEPWDCDGLDVCVNPDAEIKKIILALDVTSDVIDFAETEKANLIVSHHPFLFDKINVIDSSTATGKKVISLIKKDISAISYHTRLDKHEGGVNDSLCNALGLVPEYKVCDGLVNICYVKNTDFEEFARNVENKLNAKIRWFNNNGKVFKVALCGGGGKSCVDAVAREKADTYITGEVDHMALINCKEYGINLILGTHYATEALVLTYLKDVLENKFPDISIAIKYSEEYAR
jgi:dinuclear metal center YbgI/SA1388 family protein